MVDLIDTIVYAGRLKDKSALMSSSSGGAFTALSDFFLKNGKNAVDVQPVMPSARKRLFLWSRTKKALNTRR